MKNIFKVAILATGMLLVSCDEDLMTPFAPGAATEDVALQTSSDLQLLMNTTYATLTPFSEYQFSSTFTDECKKGRNNGGQGLTEELAFAVNPGSDGPSGIWNTYYATLAYANRVITKADQIVPVDAADEKKIQNIKAQALTLRAYSHIQLVSFFSTNPKDRNALGVMKADRVYSVLEAIGRSTNGEIYDLIDSDLNLAETLFTSSAIANANIYASKNFAIAMKARVNNLRGDYDNALTYANQVISTSGVALATFAQYKSVFHTDASGAAVEVLFKLKKTTGQTAIGSAYNFNNAKVSGGAYFEVGKSLFDLLSVDDIRYSTILFDASTIGTTNPVYPVGKHKGYNDNNPLLNDIKISRISEMYLIRAEAYASKGMFTEAANEVQSIRKVRFTAGKIPVQPVYANEQEALKDILQERRIEFAFEGYRYTDLKRLGSRAGVGVLRDATDFSFNGQVALPTSDYRFTLPIPQRELNGNVVIRSQQNPNY